MGIGEKWSKLISPFASRPKSAVQRGFSIRSQPMGIGEDVTIDSNEAVLAPIGIHGGATLRLRGFVRGDASVDSGSRLIVIGALQGSLSVAPGAEVVIEEGGTMQAALHNDGHVILRGVFGGEQTGDGTFDVQGNGEIRGPSEVLPDGTKVYNWPIEVSAPE